MGSRIRENPKHVFVCFCEVVIPTSSNSEAWILQKYPENYNDEEKLKSVSEFACPCPFTNEAVQHFSFVLTSMDSKWTYGYCRHAPAQPTLFCILSFLPWHDTFYRLLNYVAEITNGPEPNLLSTFLENLYNVPVPEPGTDLHVTCNFKTFQAHCPDHLKLPSIPENRNLAEYFNAVDPHNMMVIFASMLHERRIIMTSRKLGRLSACVQAANMLIYPMHWQHIFIPVLPRHLVDYLSAPMPFLIGVPSSLMLNVELSEFSEVVILDADNNRVRTSFKDFETLPLEIVSQLKRRLKNPNTMVRDGVARSFMRALVHLIGGYRDALKVNIGEKITFDEEAFLRTRSSSMQPFLETMLHLQIFHQFIDDRLEMLNSGIGFSDDFELEVNNYEVSANTRLKTQYKEWLTTMKKEGGIFLKNVKSKTNPAVKSAYKSVKQRSQKAYKDIRSKINEMQKQPSQSDFYYQAHDEKTKSAPSSPSVPRNDAFKLSSRMSHIADNHAGKQLSSEALNLTNSMSVSGIRRYRMLTVDEISQASDDSLSDSEDVRDVPLLDMDLMGDLQDLIFRRCSTSSDGQCKDLDSGLCSASETKVDDCSNNSFFAFEDSFCNDVFLPSPIPPPRTKRKLTSSDVVSPEETVSQSDVANKHLIKLDSLDDSIFDPLKEGDMPEDLSLFGVPTKTVVDDTVNELKEKIQKLSFLPNANQQSSCPPGVCFPPASRSAFQPVSLSAYGASSLSYPQVMQLNVNSKNLVSTLPGTQYKYSEVRPPLPPKTRIKRLSKEDQDLLDDYGLSGSPIFKPAATGSSLASVSVPETKTVLQSNGNSSDILDIFHTGVPNSNNQTITKTSWQKFA